MANKLLPCPFCGGEAIIRQETVREYNTWETAAFVMCKECFCRTSSSILSEETVIRNWNRRWKDG